MLSLLAITADSNACRHPTNEVINPAAPIGFPAVSPGQRQTGIVPPFTLQSLLQVIRNSKKRADSRGLMAPLRDVVPTSVRYVSSSYRSPDG